MEATTLAEIAEASDVPLGNVYYYFKSKTNSSALQSTPVEFTVKDPDIVREKYSPNAAQTVKEHGGEVLAANVDWEILYGDPLFRCN